MSRRGSLWRGSLFPLFPLPGSIHSVLKLDSRHFGVVAASDYKSLGELVKQAPLEAAIMPCDQHMAIAGITLCASGYKTCFLCSD